MNSNLIAKKIIGLLNPEILNSNGRFLYSASSTLCRGKIYLLGLNPGGKPNDPRWNTDIRYSFKYLPEATCAYLETWGDRQAGQHPLQKRVCWLIEQLGFDINKICANNLIFKRSQSAAKLKDFEKLADLCWPAHEFTLHIVQPKLLLVFGNSAISPFSYLEKIAKGKTATRTFASGHGNWNCRIFQGKLADLNVTVIGLPHLSRFNIIGKTRVINWIHKYL